MKKLLQLFAFSTASLFITPPVQAELPVFTEQPWLGYFYVATHRTVPFGITAKGEARFTPLKRNGTLVSTHNPIKIDFDILETLPDGKITRKKIKPATLSSAAPASIDPKEPVIITGKTTGDAAFEIKVVNDQDTLKLTGKITDKGSLKNPLSFEISAHFIPYPFQAQKKEKNAEKNFLKKISRDQIRLEPIKGGRAKIDFASEEDPLTLHPEGFHTAEVRTVAYDKLNMEFTASKNSKILVQNKGKSAIYNGFSLHWSVNPDADPETEYISIKPR